MNVRANMGKLFGVLAWGGTAVTDALSTNFNMSSYAGDHTGGAYTLLFLGLLLGGGAIDAAREQNRPHEQENNL